MNPLSRKALVEGEILHTLDQIEEKLDRILSVLNQPPVTGAGSLPDPPTQPTLSRTASLRQSYLLEDDDD